MQSLRGGHDRGCGPRALETSSLKMVEGGDKSPPPGQDTSRFPFVLVSAREVDTDHVEVGGDHRGLSWFALRVFSRYLAVL